MLSQKPSKKVGNPQEGKNGKEVEAPVGSGQNVEKHRISFGGDSFSIVVEPHPGIIEKRDAGIYN